MAVRLRPQRKPRFPKWDLPLVLNFFLELRSDLDKPLSIKELMLKTTFLVAITSAKRVSKIQALGSKEPFLTFFPDRVALLPILGSNPKVTSAFYENQEIIQERGSDCALDQKCLNILGSLTVRCP